MHLLITNFLHYPLGKSPVVIVIPCHCVIGKDGSMAGYAGGIYPKKWLLNHEGARFSKQSSLFN
jgi:methylated-DNA-[protein]-cysteine S-methyltransferase